jgi:ribosomal protein S18 acetylase RimI-like enzyme
MVEPTVTRCPASHRAEALKLLKAARDAGQQEGLAQCIVATNASDPSVWDGLLVVGSPQPTAAIWVQRAAGNAAIIWPPPSDDPVADALFRAAAAFVDERRIGVTQMIASPSDGFAVGDMASRGFERLADLVYMFAEVDRAGAQASQTSQSLQFESNAGSDSARLGAVIEQTYLGTRDCPALDGVRSLSDVIAGYRTQGDYRPQHWYLVVEGGRDVGVLLLAEHAGAASWELIYMGVVPAARGRQFGEAIVRFAIETVRRAGGERIVLAVDAANAPARRMYQRSGFHEWERRIVFARLAASTASSASSAH